MDATLPSAQVILVGTGGILTGQDQIAFWREAVHTAPPTRPTTIVVDLTNAVLLPSGVESLILKLTRLVASGHYGPSKLVIATPDQSLRNVISGLALFHGLALYLCDSPQSLHDAKAAGATSTEEGSLEIIRTSGGAVSASALAQSADLELSAASNRLVSLEKRGYVFRVKRSGRDGDLFVDPRIAPLPTWYLESNSTLT